ncbi:hypothetical protein ACU60T_24490 [Klebsiella aerogenes]
MKQPCGAISSPVVFHHVTHTPAVPACDPFNGCGAVQGLQRPVLRGSLTQILPAEVLHDRQQAQLTHQQCKGHPVANGGERGESCHIQALSYQKPCSSPVDIPAFIQPVLCDIAG